MGARPRVAVLVYGSLLDPAELRELVGGITGRVWPVKLDGYERICNQTASWRSADGDERAVLNVVRTEGAWCNGLVLTDLRRAEWQAFRDRERGYRLTEVDPDSIDPYDGNVVDTSHVDTTEPPLAEQDLRLVTTGTNVDPDIAPIGSYLEGCLDGANQWGRRFREDFTATTAANAGCDLPAGFTE